MTRTAASSLGVISLLLGWTATTSAQPLQSGQPVTIEVAGQSVVTSLFFETPADTNGLQFLLSNGAGDFDLMVRKDMVLSGSTFQDFIDVADYFSATGDSDEYINVTSYMSPPSGEGTWHLAVFNFDTMPATVTVTATALNDNPKSAISVVFDDTSNECDTDPWFDDAPYTPNNGNNATTLGDARRNALNEAVRLLNLELETPVPIVVQACWEELDWGPTGGVLAQASPSSFSLDTPGLPALQTWYPMALLARLSGTDACRLGAATCGTADIRAAFNIEPEWYLGLDQPLGSARDMVTVAMHEVTHGLGFISLVDVETGARAESTVGGQFDDIFSLVLGHAQNGNPVPYLDLTDAGRVSANSSVEELVWRGVRATASSKNLYMAVDSGHPQMYAPSPIEPGSSVSHVRNLRYPRGEMMRASMEASTREMGIAKEMLEDIGWHTETIASEPTRGLWSDRSKQGHGGDLQKAGEQYFWTFYSYGDDGTGEWYLSLDSDADISTGFSGDALYFTFDPDKAATETDVGTFTIEFGVAVGDGACDDGVDRSSAPTLALLHIEINEAEHDWCIEPQAQLLTPPDGIDATGHWYGGSADDGWGVTVQLTAGDEDQDIVVVTLYYYDANNTPRWAQGVAEVNAIGDTTVPMAELTGYCRDCTPDIPTEAGNGSITLHLPAPSVDPEAGNTLTIDVSYLTAPGGDWIRNGVPVQLISDPN